MRVFVYEFVTGGGLARQELPCGLVHEADLMVHALLRDLEQIPGVEVCTSRDPRLPPLNGFEVITPDPGEAPRAYYERGLATADAGWPVAPETGGVLERLAQSTIDLQKILLGCPARAVRLAASKYVTATVLRDAGIPVVPTFLFAADIPDLPGRWVVKPDDGAGSEDAMVVADAPAARRRLQTDPGRLAAQPWLDGEALSLSLICADGRALMLAGNRQRVRNIGGRLVLSGISVNAPFDRGGILRELADRIAAAMPTLWGYVGVDLVWTRFGPVVLEINPRLTTSYCGLRDALRTNVAAMVLDLLRHGASPHWRAPQSSATVELNLEAVRG